MVRINQIKYTKFGEGVNENFGKKIPRKDSGCGLTFEFSFKKINDSRKLIDDDCVCDKKDYANY